MEFIAPVSLEKLTIYDRLVFNPKEVFGTDVELGIFAVEIAGIQSFVTASDAKKYIAGASSLLESTLMDFAEYIKRIVCPEALIYASGGSLLALVPPSYYENLKSFGEKLFWDRTGKVRLKFPSKFKFRLFELKYGPEVLRDDSLWKKRSFGSTVSLAIKSLETRLLIDKENKGDISDLCKLCYENFGSKKYEIENEEQLICESCYKALEENKRIRELLKNKGFFKVSGDGVEIVFEERVKAPLFDVLDRVVQALRKKLERDPIASEMKMNNLEIIFKPVETWDHLGRQHLIVEEGYEVYEVAFIKGDGDNFGKIKESMRNITSYRQISQIFSEIIQRPLGEAFADVILSQIRLILKSGKKGTLICDLPFDIVFVGGDDFLVLIDSAFVFNFLLSYRKSILKLLGERKDRYMKNTYENLSIFPLGVSIGVAIVKNRMPIKSTLQVLNKLVERAKSKSKEESKVKKFGGEIFVAVHRFDEIPTVSEVEDVLHTIYPLSGKELIDFAKEVEYFIENNISPNWIRSVFGEIKPKDRENALLNLLYKASRSKGIEKEALLRILRFHENFNKNGVWRFFNCDIADSVDILTRDAKILTKREFAKILVGD